MSSPAAPSSPVPLTAEEFFELQADLGRAELVEGQVRRSTPAGYEHGRVAAVVLFAVGAFVRQRALGEVLAGGTGFLLRRGPDTVRAPDVAFVRRDRVPGPDDAAGFAELAPDLAIEVVSPSDRAGDVNAKALTWLDAGVRLVWVLYPGTRVVAVHRPGDVITLLREDAVLDGGDVLPGFTVPVAELFGRP